MGHAMRDDIHGFSTEEGGKKQVETMSGMDEHFQQALMQEQQRAMIMEAVRKITNVAFDKCIQKPDSSLSSRQATCIAQTTTSYLESSSFLANKIMNKQ